MPAVNFVIYVCLSSTTTPEVITIQELGGALHWRENIVADRWQFERPNLKPSLVYLFLLTQIFQYIGNW